ncbi:MAG: sialidase family protein [Vicinamibacterales bacterium]
MLRRLTIATAAVATLGAAGAAGPVDLLPSPAGAGSANYALTTAADGHTYLTWMEPSASGGQVLRFSRLDGTRWGAPVTIAEGRDWFVNWIDHPSLTATADGRLFAHWLVHTGKAQGGYGYGIRVATSADAGRTWTTAFEEGFANVSDYAGFLTFAPSAGGLDAVFLTPLAPDDGTVDEAHAVKTLGAVRFGEDGRAGSREVIDTDVCSCCSTDMAITADGPIAVYRDHLPGEIRDIAIVRKVGGRWSAPAPVHRDGWAIAACPTNGPAVAARERDAAVAWFTAAGDRPQVQVAFSTDAGATFGPPVRVDDGNPAGWADVLLLDRGRALVSWLERTGTGTGEVRVREVTPAGVQPAIVVAPASSGRATGVPMLARSGDHAIVAWRDGTVRTARLALPAASTARH